MKKNINLEKKKMVLKQSVIKTKNIFLTKLNTTDIHIMNNMNFKNAANIVASYLLNYYIRKTNEFFAQKLHNIILSADTYNFPIKTIIEEYNLLIEPILDDENWFKEFFEPYYYNLESYKQFCQEYVNKYLQIIEKIKNVKNILILNEITKEFEDLKNRYEIDEIKNMIKIFVQPNFFSIYEYLREDNEIKAIAMDYILMYLFEKFGQGSDEIISIIFSYMTNELFNNEDNKDHNITFIDICSTCGKACYSITNNCDTFRFDPDRNFLPYKQIFCENMSKDILNIIFSFCKLKHIGIITQLSWTQYCTFSPCSKIIKDFVALKHISIPSCLTKLMNMNIINSNFNNNNNESLHDCFKLIKYNVCKQPNCNMYIKILKDFKSHKILIDAKRKIESNKMITKYRQNIK
jgi:hypothetical protein